MKQIIKDWSPVIALVAIFLLLMNLRECKPKKTEHTTIPEFKAQDSLKDKVDSLDKVSKTLLINAYKKDSTIGFYVNKYRFYKAKFLSKQDSTPYGREIIFLTQACDSVITQDSIRNLSWKELHKNDSTQILSLKSLVKVDSVIFANTVANKNDTIKILTKEIRKQKWQKRGIIALWALREGVGVGAKIKP